MSDIEILTSSRAWSANPQDYNCLNFLTFGDDGLGRLVLGYGQTILADVRYRFEIPRPGILSIALVETTEVPAIGPRPRGIAVERDPLGERLVAAEHGNARELKYLLRTGDFRGQMNMGTERGPFTYHFRTALTLERAPYCEATVLACAPHGLLAPIDYTYFGHSV